MTVTSSRQSIEGVPTAEELRHRNEAIRRQNDALLARLDARGHDAGPVPLVRSDWQARQRERERLGLPRRSTPGVDDLAVMRARKEQAQERAAHVAPARQSQIRVRPNAAALDGLASLFGATRPDEPSYEVGAAHSALADLARTLFHG